MDDRSLNMSDESGKGKKYLAVGWVARRHYESNRNIQEIYYLPKGSPDDEIRLLEVDNSLISQEFSGSVKPIIMGVVFHGSLFQVCVVDINRDQLERVKNGSLSLPEGWSLEGSESIVMEN